MRRKDVKVGMKVVPFKKSSCMWTSHKAMDEYLDDCNHKQAEFFRKNGFLYVAGIRGKEFVLWYDGKMDTGDYFLAEDFEPYVELQVKTKTKTKKEKDMKGKLKFEELRIGDKLTLRDDLVVGKKYGGITYLKEMQENSGVVTVSSIDEDITLNEGYYRFYYSKEMFKEFIVTTTEIKTDLLFDKPRIEKSNGEVYLFTGRSIIYINEELGAWGMSSCSPEDFKKGLYSERVGKAIAYFNAYEEREGK
jgi:hypothetical protein